MEYNIKLKEGAKQFAQTTPKRVAIFLLSAVKKELNLMEQLVYFFALKKKQNGVSI